MLDITHGSKDQLGKYSGGSSCSAAGLADENMAQGILRALKGERSTVTSPNHGGD